MDRPNIHELFATFGRSEQTQSSWPLSLSEADQAFILSLIEQEQKREEATGKEFFARLNSSRTGMNNGYQ